MTGDVRSTLLHLAGPIVALAAVLVACRLRRWPLADTLALRWPSLRQVALWGTVFAALFVAEEYVYTALGFSQGHAWGDRFSGPILALRILGMVLLAPIAEEVVFRGILFKRISTTRLGAVGAAIVSGVVFAGVHVQYEAALLAFLLVDGLFYGVVRWRTNSLALPIAFHSLGNLYVVYERLNDSGLFY